MSDTPAFGIAGLLGWPVAHSRSPVIHNHWLERYGIPGRYTLFPVPPERLPDALKGLSALRMRGCNVTTPHKQAVMPLIDDVDPLARKIGAVNTIVVQEDGSLRGFNNDGNGFVQSIRDAQPAWRPDTGPIAVLGAGGAARAVVASLAVQGAREIRVVNRTLARAVELQSLFGPPVTTVPWDERETALEGVALLANATDQGMAGKPSLDIRLERLPQTAIVGDLIYTPPETPLLAAARAGERDGQRARPAAEPGAARIQCMVWGDAGNHARAHPGNRSDLLVPSRRVRTIEATSGAYAFIVGGRSPCSIATPIAASASSSSSESPLTATPPTTMPFRRTGNPPPKPT